MSAAIPKEESNYLRFYYLMMKVAPKAVRIKFNTEFAPIVLQKTLNQSKSKLSNLRRDKIINAAQWEHLFPRTGTVSSENFDCSLMICLLRNLADITIDDIHPDPNNKTDGGNLSRLKYFRNQYAHPTDCTISDEIFEVKWKEISEIIQRIGGNQFKQTCEEAKVTKLDENDKDLNEGESPLFIASKKGHKNVVNLFLDYECDPNICTDSNESSIHIAAQNGHLDIVKVLLKKKANPNLKAVHGVTPLYKAAEEGHFDVVQYLLEHQADPNKITADVETPLFIAAKRGHFEIVHILLQYGSNKTTNGCNLDGMSPLYIASREGHTNIVELLLKKGANTKNSRYTILSPLHAATGMKHNDIVKLLLNHKADPSHCNQDGVSPMMAASQRGYEDTAEIFRQTL